MSHRDVWGLTQQYSATNFYASAQQRSIQDWKCRYVCLQVFKKRFYKHITSFEKEIFENPTNLSTHVWDLKNKNKNFDIKWSVIDRAQDFNPATKKCRLCLKEKFYIIFQPDGATLNLRSELFSSCRHKIWKTLSKLK